MVQLLSRLHKKFTIFYRFLKFISPSYKSLTHMKPTFHFITFIILMLASTCRVFSQDIRFNKVSLPDEINEETVIGITQDLHGNIWLCLSASSGLYQYDGAQFKSFVHDQFNPNSLADNYVECVYADKSGNIWAGTYGFGLDKFDPQTGNFTHYRHSEKDPYSISGDSITCIIQDRQGFLWIGTNWNGLDRMDPATGKFTHYKYNKNDPTSLSFNQIRALFEDKQGVIWVGTGANGPAENPGKKGGLNRFNNNTGTFTRYMHDKNNANTLVDDRVRAIFEDSHGNFWVGTAGDGLHTMDRASGTFERHAFDPAHPDKLSRPSLKKIYTWADDNITFITEDSRGAIWIGTFGNGVNHYEPESKKITHYSGQKSGKSNLAYTTILFCSKHGVLWCICSTCLC